MVPLLHSPSPLPFSSLFSHTQSPPIVVPLAQIGTDTEHPTLTFRIDEAVPLVLLQDLRWFYVADLGSDPYAGQEITHLTTRNTGSTLTFSDFADMRYINLTISIAVRQRSTVSGETDQGRYFLVATNPAGVSFAYIDLLTQVSRKFQEIGEVSALYFVSSKINNLLLLHNLHLD